MPKRKRVSVHDDCREYHALILVEDKAGRKAQLRSLWQHGLLCQHELRRLGLAGNAWLASSYHGDGNEVYTAGNLEMALAGIAFKLNAAGIADAGRVLIVELDCQPGRVLLQVRSLLSLSIGGMLTTFVSSLSSSVCRVQDGTNPGFSAVDLAAAGADSMLARSQVHNVQIARVWWDPSRIQVTGMFKLSDQRYGDGKGQQLLEAACSARGPVRRRRWRGRDDWVATFMAHLEAFEGRGETALERWKLSNAAPSELLVAGASQRRWEHRVRVRGSKIPASLLSRARTSGLLWTHKEIEQEMKRALLELMTPTNLRRWGYYRTAFDELLGQGFTGRLLQEVLKGRFGSRSSVKKTLVPIPVELTCLDVDNMDQRAARKAHTAYVGPLRAGDPLRRSVVLLRQALKQAINSRA